MLVAEIGQLPLQPLQLGARLAKLLVQCHKLNIKKEERKKERKKEENRSMENSGGPNSAPPCFGGVFWPAGLLRLPKEATQEKKKCRE